jgi:hypothetical protein
MPDEDKNADAPRADTDDQTRVAEDVQATDEKQILRDEEPAPSPDPGPSRRGGSFFGVVFGGALAAAAGFGLAQMVPQGWPLAAQAPGDSRIEAQATEIAALKASLAELAARPAPDLSGEVARLEQDIESRFAALPQAADPGPMIEDLRQTVDAALTGFQSRLDALEKASTGSGGGASSLAVAAFERDIAALRSRIDAIAAAGPAATGEIEQVVAGAKAELASALEQARQLGAEAESAAQAARLDAAVGRIAAALEAGGPYASAVSELNEQGVEIPAALSDMAGTGVASLVDLQRRFPSAARTALDAALRADVGEGWTDRLGTFLRTQTGVRSLEPREGNDPDAILSRADAALQAGDVALALSELQALPEPARAAMSGWMTDAAARDAALAALSGVVVTLDTQ